MWIDIGCNTSGRVVRQCLIGTVWTWGSQSSNTFIGTAQCAFGSVVFKRTNSLSTHNIAEHCCSLYSIYLDTNLEQLSVRNHIPVDKNNSGRCRPRGHGLCHRVIMDHQNTKWAVAPQNGQSPFWNVSVISPQNGCYHSFSTAKISKPWKFHEHRVCMTKILLICILLSSFFIQKSSL